LILSDKILLRKKIIRWQVKLEENKRILETINKYNKDLDSSQPVIDLEYEKLEIENRKLERENEDLRRKYDYDVNHLKNIIIGLTGENKELKSKMASLEDTVRVITRSLNLNSTNSSKPSSTDSMVQRIENKLRTKSLRKKSGKKPGGQKGHKGETLKMVETPDAIKKYNVCNCDTCNANLKEVKPIGIEKGQIKDLEIRIVTTEHQAEIKKCPVCGNITKANLPEGVIKSRITYGEGISALSVYLNVYQDMPYLRTKEFFEDIFDVKLSQGTLFNKINEYGDKLTSGYELIKEVIKHKEKVVHFDETGVNTDTDKSWIHVATSKLNAFYESHQKRGRVAMDEIGILPVFNGTAIHDSLSSYNKYKCKHGLCNAHILRELNDANENGNQQWAKKLFDLLLKIEKAVEDAQCNLTKGDKEKFNIEYAEIVEEAKSENYETNYNQEQKKYNKINYTAFIKRLDTRRDEVLLFMIDPEVPFTNNLAERSLRPIKVKQKVSGIFRSDMGLDNYLKIKSCIDTIRRKGKKVYHLLRNASNENSTIEYLGI